MPLLFLSIALLVGVIMGSLLHLPVAVWLGLAGAMLVWWIIPRLLYVRKTGKGDIGSPSTGMGRVKQFLSDILRKSPVSWALLLMALFCGAARWQFAQPMFKPAHIASYNDNGDPLVITGVVDKMPDVRDAYVNLQVSVESLREEDVIEHHTVEGELLARVPVTAARLAYGDRVTLAGLLQTPPEGEEFSYADYLANQGIYSYMPYAQVSILESGQGSPLLTWIYEIKSVALHRTARYWPDPEASLLAGILLGVESGIPYDVEQAFQATGTSHIIAISGFNITIVAGLFTWLSGRVFGRKWGALAAGLGIAAYTLLVGADAAVVRAAIMGGLVLMARQIGRRQDGLNSLGITAAVMALINPLVLWDVSFQLSFAATLGLVWYADPFNRKFIQLASKYFPENVVNRMAGPVGEYLLFTLAAQVTTLPVIVYHFQQVSLISVIANLVILPAQPPIMVLGGIALILGFLANPLGQAAAYLCYPFAAYTIRLVEWFAGLPGGVWITGQVGLWLVIVYYLVLIIFTFKWPAVKTHLPQIKPSLIIAALALASMLVWPAALQRPDGRLHVVVMDVGMGEGVLIQTPEGRYVLIDGGEKTSQLSQGLGRWLPLYHRQLDFLVVASSQQEQIAAIAGIVPRFPPAQALWAGSTTASSEARYLQQALVEAQIPIIPLQPGHVLDLGWGARLETLAVGNRGATLLLTWGNFRMLLPLGTNREDMEELDMGKQVSEMSALMLADSGYAPANPPEWITNLKPQVVLLSVRTGNLQGLPSPETIQSLQGYSVLRTDQNGWVHLTTDGESMWVEAERHR
jgi:competence protein ComEC